MVVDRASEHEREASDRAKHEEQRREHEEERRRYRSRFRAVPDREPDWESVQEKPPDGEIRELGRVESTDAELVEALAAYLNRNPHRSSETPSWLAVALWAEEDLPGKPAPAEVEVALASPELRAVAA